jgi:hypothetical protein
MAKDRILGSATTLEIYTNVGGMLTIEVDSFSARSVHSQKQWHPLGEIGQRTQTVYVGYELDFKTGKIDSQVRDFFNYIDSELLAGRPAPRVRVVETIKHFDGNNEVNVYPDTVLADYQGDTSSADDEIKETFKGYCTTKVTG